MHIFFLLEKFCLFKFKNEMFRFKNKIFIISVCNLIYFLFEKNEMFLCDIKPNNKFHLYRNSHATEKSCIWSAHFYVR